MEKQEMTWKEWFSILVVCSLVGFIILVVLATIVF